MSNFIKFKLCLLLVWLVLVGSLFVKSVFAESVCDNITMETISQHLEIPGVLKIMQKEAKGSVCEVVLRTRESLAPIYVGQDFVIIGQLFQNREHVTQKTLSLLEETIQNENQQIAREKAVQETYRKNFLKARLNDLEECVFMTLNPPENVNDQVYIVTDPGCSHCKTALKALHKLALESGIMVKIIIYPVLGKNSKAMAASAICKKYSYQDYMEMVEKSEKPFLSCKAGKNYIKKTVRFLERADIDSVPLIIGNRAEWIVEGNKIQEVVKNLGIE